MPEKYTSIKNRALKTAADAMCIAARTAPKAKGEDNLVITVLNKTEKERLAGKMKKISKRDSRPGFERDASNVEKADVVVIIGASNKIMGLNCGFCGYPTCAELKKNRGICAYTTMDLGIALGSAVSIASERRVDNRLMYSIGKAAMELGFLGKNVIQAIGIPLAATGKSPFFDR